MKLFLSPALDSPTSSSADAGVRGHRLSPDDRNSFSDACDGRPGDQQQPSSNSLLTHAASAGLISRPTLYLLLATATLAGIWLLLLPALLHLAPVRDHVDHLDAHGVDASAMYYTELDPTMLLDHRQRGASGPSAASEKTDSLGAEAEELHKFRER